MLRGIRMNVLIDLMIADPRRRCLVARRRIRGPAPVEHHRLLRLDRDRPNDGQKADPPGSHPYREDRRPPLDPGPGGARLRRATRSRGRGPARVLMLLPQHQRLIDASAIAADVAAARGYRSVTTKAELVRLGFGDRQAIVPTLLVPVWDAWGNLATYQHRPDAPRVVNGRALKYETPSGGRMVLDVPPGARAGLGCHDRPLFVTEGCRKADAAVSAGLCCVALLGVWNWRGTNAQGGRTALADWETVDLKNGREVYVAFDSDVMLKRAVRV